MRRLIALIKKESLQIIRDTSSIMIAFVLPLILLFIFGYGVNLDNNNVTIGVVLEETTQKTASLEAAFIHSRFLSVTTGMDRREFYDNIVAGKIRGVVIIPQTFTAQNSDEFGTSKIQVIADGSEPNIASFVQNYAAGVLHVWEQHQDEDKGLTHSHDVIAIDQRYWYNPELKSRNFLIPGSIAIIMTLIGTLLTALVIAREWERGTMEALMSTPVTITQILLGKLIPYFILGIGSMIVCVTIAHFWYEVPFRGSFITLLAVTTVFLITALGQGLLISSFARSQFLASQMALIAAFLPAFMLSGFIFEISSMPLPIRTLTYIFPARYFVSCLQTLFLAGTIKILIAKAMGAIALIGIIFYIIIAKKTVKRLDA